MKKYTVPLLLYTLLICFNNTNAQLKKTGSKSGSIRTNSSPGFFMLRTASFEPRAWSKTQSINYLCDLAPLRLFILHFTF